MLLTSLITLLSKAVCICVPGCCLHFGVPISFTLFQLAHPLGYNGRGPDYKLTVFQPAHLSECKGGIWSTDLLSSSRSTPLHNVMKGCKAWTHYPPPGPLSWIQRVILPKVIPHSPMAEDKDLANSSQLWTTLSGPLSSIVPQGEETVLGSISHLISPFSQLCFFPCFPLPVWILRKSHE